MAEALTTDRAPTSILSGMDNLSLIKQTGLMIGLAASVAFGVVIALWAQGTDMRALNNVNRQSMSDIISYLEQKKISYKLNSQGNLLVPQDKFQKIQIDLTSQGYVGAAGEDYLRKDSGFGVSQRLERARLVRTQENQLAKTIEQFSGIKSVQVHLAIPRQISFISSKNKASASVVLSLYNRNRLDRSQAKSIVDLVSASIPNLDADDVSVSDQFGRLYHSASMSDGERESEKELSAELTRQQKFSSKIENLLAPILGPENFTVQVNVDMSFVKNEQTQKKYNPQIPALKSEKRLETSNDTSGNGGIPGALSNQPPAASTIPENVATVGDSGELKSTNSKHVESERYYDIDTTISHTKQQTAQIKRISVSLGINFMEDLANPGTRIARPKSEIDRIQRLIQGVIGYNQQRGDIIMIDSFEFITNEPVVDNTPIEFYQQPMFKSLWRPVTAVIGIFLLIFGVLRPIMKKLATPIPGMQQMDPLSIGAGAGAGGSNASLLPSSESTDLLMAPAPKELEQVVRAKKVVGDDPKMVAALVQNWISEDE